MALEIETSERELEALWRRAAETFRPPPSLTLSEWADKYFYLPAKKGGKWVTRPYQRGMMDAISDPLIERVSIRKSSRVGYTSILQAHFAYIVSVDPCGILDVQPTVEDAEGYSKEQLTETIEANECLRGLIREVRSRGSDNTILQKAFNGGRWWGVGANSGRGFRRIGPRIARCDEVDEFPPSAGTAGDPVLLAWRRTQDAAYGRKLIIGSTPEIKGISRIDAAFEEGDQRYFFIACPFCRNEQYLRWGGPDKDYGIKWPKDRPADAYYLCEKCHKAITEGHKEDLVERGVWLPTATPAAPNWASFHIWAGYSLDPSVRWGAIATEFLAVKDDPEKLKTWVNQVLGESFEDRGKQLNAHWLSARREHFPTSKGMPVIPQGAALLTAFSDTQDDRLEVGIYGWGLGEECWVSEYHVLPGDPAQAQVWEDLDALIQAPRRHVLGPEVFIRGVGIDTGGHHTQEAYAYAARRMRRTMPDGTRQLLFAMKGSKDRKAPIWPPSASQKVTKAKLWMIGVNAAKDTLHKRLRVTTKGPGYLHFPAATKLAYDWCTDSWFEALASEKKVQKTDKGRFPYEVWEKIKSGQANEPWDCLVGAYAVLKGLQFFRFKIERELERIQRNAGNRVARPIDPADAVELDMDEDSHVVEPEETSRAPVASPAPPPAPQSPGPMATRAQPKKARVIRSSWMSR